MQFIPDQISPLFIRVFRTYVRWLFKRRFHRVWLRSDYRPKAEGSTLYYLNHHSWWDGLIPFLLNEYHFRQRGRALMELQQMQRYGFFKKIGAFSIDRGDPQSAVKSLRYAVQLLKQPGTGLYIYPEGKIVPACIEPEFESGAAWMATKVEQIDLVPIALYQQSIRSDKPELHIHVGEPQEIPKKHVEDINRRMQLILRQMLSALHQTAGFQDEGFDAWL